MKVSEKNEDYICKKNKKKIKEDERKKGPPTNSVIPQWNVWLLSRRISPAGLPASADPDCWCCCCCWFSLRNHCRSLSQTAALVRCHSSSTSPLVPAVRYLSLSPCGIRDSEQAKTELPPVEVTLVSLGAAGQWAVTGC